MVCAILLHTRAIPPRGIARVTACKPILRSKVWPFELRGVVHHPLARAAVGIPRAGRTSESAIGAPGMFFPHSPWQTDAPVLARITPSSSW